MRKAAAAALALAACLVAAAPTGARTPAVPTRATLDACHSGPAAADRYVMVSAQMGAVPHSARMQVRFSLLGRLDHARRYTRLAGPGLDSWYSSASSRVTIFGYHKEIVALPAPGLYRAVVQFRWLDARGRVLRLVRRTTATCWQPDQRPDLVPTGVSVTSGDTADRARYLVGVANAGRSDAGPFQVRLVVAGQPQPLQTIPGLAAHAATTLEIEGPRCPAGARLRVVVDAAHQVDEAREGNNTLTSRCPAPTNG